MLKTKHKYIASAAGLILFVIFGASNVQACLCSPVSVKERVKTMKKEAHAIFDGTVESVEEISLRTYKVVLSVKRSWKGQKVNDYTIYTIGASPGGCGVSFIKGRSYLVYAATDRNNRLVTEICSGTREITLAKKDLRALGKPVFSAAERSM
jgi:hypothetical protein